MKTPAKIACFVLLAMASSSVYSAGACTYREAIMALERGNSVRGVALMRMAHRDGDERASQFLAKLDIPVETTNVVSHPRDDSLVSLIQGDFR